MEAIPDAIFSVSRFFLHLLIDLSTIPPDPRSVYYLIQALVYLAVYTAVLVGSGISMWRLASTLSNCALRPTILPKGVFLFVLNHLAYPAGCCLIPAFLLAAKFPEYLVIRFFTASIATIFHLGDSCRTGAHNGYLMLWNVWSFCLLDLETSLGLAFGVAVWFILSSGLSKIWIGGARPWMHPDTMQSILKSFVYKTPKAAGPLVNPLCRISIESNVLCAIYGVATVLFEVVYIILIAVFGLRKWQMLTTYLMVLLHVGITLVQSTAIGVFFLPNIASYVAGFYDFSADSIFQSRNLDTGESDTSREFQDQWTPFSGYCWFLGISLNAIALMYTMISGKLIAEDWPLTTMSLFPWNGEQWRRLNAAFVEGTTRMVAIPPGLQKHMWSRLESKTPQEQLHFVKEVLIGVPVVPIIGAARMKDDVDLGRDGQTRGEGNAQEGKDTGDTAGISGSIRHMIFGTSPYAKDLRSHTLRKKSGAESASASQASNQQPLLSTDDDAENSYLYDIYTRVLGPTTYQQELLEVLQRDVFPMPDEEFRFPRSKKDMEARERNANSLTWEVEFIMSLKLWLQRKKRLVEVSTGETLMDCAIVRVDEDDVVVEMIAWRKT